MMTGKALRARTPYKNFGSREHLNMDPVEVFCRIRPVLDNNVELCIKAVDDQTLQITEPVSTKPVASSQEDDSLKATQAKFTHLFDMDSEQSFIFNRVALDLCEDVLRGLSGLLFTYGITGSGKTYTMTGCPSDSGILPRCLDVIFNSIAKFQAESYVFKPDGMNGYDVRSKALAALDRVRYNLCPSNGTLRPGCAGTRMKKIIESEWEIGNRSDEQIKIPLSKLDEDNAFAVFVSYVEIYNNYIYDLLDPSLDKNKLPQSKILREDQNRSMYVSGATEVEVRSTQEAFVVLASGQKVRRVAHTVLNTESSRSHSVFNIRLVRAPFDETGSDVLQDKSKVLVSQLSLVDLAGSERSSRTGNTGDRIRETGCINSSLMCLRQCIEILRENQRAGADRAQIVPYRESKLTLLFKNYFDGEGKVRMIVCVNPSALDYDENLNVLKFAEMTKDVRVQPASAVLCDTDGFTPGRRKAAQILQQIRDELDLEAQRTAVLGSASIIDDMFRYKERPPAAFSYDSLNDVMDFSRLRSFFDEKLKWRHDLIHEEIAKRLSLDEELRKYVVDSEFARRRHEECGRIIKEMDKDNQKLKLENRTLSHKLLSCENRLIKFERDARYLQNQEEHHRKREREMVANADKLRLLKEVCDSGATTAARKRPPSPPPKPSRYKDTLQQRRTRLQHRRSRSIGDLATNENLAPKPSNRIGVVCPGSASGSVAVNKSAYPITPYCPGRSRRVKQMETTSSDSSDAGPIKRRSEESANPDLTTAAKRGREI